VCATATAEGNRGSDSFALLSATTILGGPPSLLDPFLCASNCLLLFATVQTCAPENQDASGVLRPLSVLLTRPAAKDVWYAVAVVDEGSNAVLGPRKAVIPCNSSCSPTGQHRVSNSAAQALEMEGPPLISHGAFHLALPAAANLPQLESGRFMPAKPRTL
jgi:hypothetical protein